jgi:hypothetical protein
MPHLDLDETERETLAAALSAGQSAIVFATDPARWPEFAAFAEEHSRQPWDEADRQHMRAGALLLFRLAQALVS